MTQKTIDPNEESLSCPYCESSDIRYKKQTDQWRCSACNIYFDVEPDENGNLYIIGK